MEWVLSYLWFVLAIVLNSKMKFISVNLTVWCGVAMYNERAIRLCVYRHLLTNHLHGKAAELCLANS